VLADTRWLVSALGRRCARLDAVAVAFLASQPEFSVVYDQFDVAELEYLRTLGQYLIHECDKVLQECNRLADREPSNELLGSGPSLEN
jgi:hypothetical protein